MCRLAMPMALCLATTLALADPHQHGHAHAHDNLGAHDHGVATLNMAIEGDTLVLELETPAMNMVGFEHQPTSDAERARVQDARERLAAPLELFNLPGAAGCELTEHRLDSPLFAGGRGHSGDHGNEHGHTHDHDPKQSAEHAHSDIEASYTFTCAQPAQLSGIDLTPFFAQFPQTERIVAQAIGPKGQHAADLAPSRPQLDF
ncbi:DUF2796 domain-containing protein [Stutzerimonas tarimensis]|uniref:DUF2796 domain-containing protein n=1 Tax=Stutzerimonas tarimensis TaxID=1507735 RepID=A0ABV7T4G5_9GAMM